MSSNIAFRLWEFRLGAFEARAHAKSGRYVTDHRSGPRHSLKAMLL
jgi:hypothetical protein